MVAKGNDYVKKEWLAVLAGCNGVKTEHSKEVVRCRLCECQCHLRMDDEMSLTEALRMPVALQEPRVQRAQEKRKLYGDGCDRCRETLGHVLRGGCNSRMRELLANNQAKLEDTLQGVAQPWEWDVIEWMSRGSVLQGGFPLKVQCDQVGTRRMTPSPFSKAPKRRLNWTCPLLKSWFCRAWKRFSTHARGREESANLRREENLAAESMSSEHDSVESRRAQSSVVVSSRQSSSRLVAKKPAGVVQGIPPTALVIQLNRAFQHVSQNEIKL